MTSADHQPYRLARLEHGSGPALVLAHGGGGGAELNWGPVLHPLGQRFSVVAPDYPAQATHHRPQTRSGSTSWPTPSSQVGWKRGTNRSR